MSGGGAGGVGRDDNDDEDADWLLIIPSSDAYLAFIRAFSSAAVNVLELPLAAGIVGMGRAVALADRLVRGGG